MADSQDTDNGQTDVGDVDLVDFTRGLIKAAQLPPDDDQRAQKMLDAFAGGGTLSDVCGLSHTDLEVVYSVARTCYDNRRYDDALTMFDFLSFMESTSAKYWMGKGAAQQMLGDYEAAVESYACCTILDVDDARPQLQAGFCLMQLGKTDEAAAALEGALLAADATEATKLQARALLAKLEAVPAGASA